MRFNVTLACWLLCAVVGLATRAAAGEAKTPGIKVEVQLVWGTTNSTSPNPSHTPVEQDVEKRLKQLPLKWNFYYMVNKTTFSVAAAGTHKEPLSSKCDVEVKDVGNGKFEVSLFGKGKQVHKRVQALPKGEMLVFGGEAPEATTWLVVVRRIE